jgi:hypothetical protein
MSWYCREPTLEEILSDPIVTALMRADSVDPRELGAMLGRIAEGLIGNDADDRDDDVLVTTGAMTRMERGAARECRC